MIPLNNKLRLYRTVQSIFNSLVSSRILATLRPDEGDGNKNVKAIRAQLCTRNTLFGSFLGRQGRTTTCQISRFMEDVNQTFFFFYRQFSVRANKTSARQRARSAQFFSIRTLDALLKRKQRLALHRLTRCMIGCWRHTAGNKPVMDRHPIQGKFWRIKG